MEQDMATIAQPRLGVTLWKREQWDHDASTEGLEVEPPAAAARSSGGMTRTERGQP